MSWFMKKKKPSHVDPTYTYPGDKKPTLNEQVTALLQNPRFVGIQRESTSTYKITIRVWSGSSMKNMSYTETLDRVMNWAMSALEGKKI